MRTASTKQPPLLADPAIAREGSLDLVAAFRRLYFHLYTNSNASRAERLIEDLSLVLLLKLALERGDQPVPAAFLHGRKSANETLLPILRRSYPSLVTEDLRFTLSDESLRHALADLEPVAVMNAPGHVLGDAFQALVGPRLRGEKGQFFTPRTLVRSIVEIVAPRPGEHVLDPACGTGGFLAEAWAYQAENSRGEQTGSLTGMEKDTGLARLATALLEIASGGQACVRCANSLMASEWETQGLRDAYDVILTNPPFGARIGIKDPATLRSYELGHQWVASDGGPWRKTATLLSAQDPQTLFLELCVRRLKSGGRMGIVLPEGVFGNRQNGYIWDWLRSQGTIVALLDCPRTTFQPGTDTKTNVLIFEKRVAKAPRGPARVRVAVALECGHDRRGRTKFPDGTSRPDELIAIGQAYRLDGSDRWREVEITNRYYLVPRYYIQDVPPTGAEASLLRDVAWVTLGDLVKDGSLAVRKGHEVGADAYGTGEVPFVRTSDISNFEIAADPTKGVSDEVYQSYRGQQRLAPGDIIMVVDGRYRIGATALITPNNARCIVQSHFRILSLAKNAPFDEYALLFALNLPSVKTRIRNLVFVQSTLGTLGNRLFELQVPVLSPGGPWQDAVDQFRASLQARDELLRRLKSVAGGDVEL